MGRDLKLERTWRERMRQYEQSGLTVRQFCEREGLVAHQFSWWRAELKRRSADPASTKKRPRQRMKSARAKKTPQLPKAVASFVPVEVEPSLSTQAIEIVLEQPPRIRVTPGFDAEVLREVVRVLEQS